MQNTIISKIDEIIDVIDKTPDYGIVAMVGLGAVNWIAPNDDSKNMKTLYDELKDILNDCYGDRKDDSVLKPFFDDTVYLNYTWRKYKEVKKHLITLKEYIKSLA